MELYGQFLLIRRGQEAPPTWANHHIGDWTLAAHPALPVLPVRRAGASDDAIGYLLGLAADEHANLVSRELRLDLPSDLAAVDDAIERQLYRLGGRYACLLVAGDVNRFYLDPVGSLAAVYAAHDRRRLASTSTALVFPDQAAYRARHEAMPRMKPNNFHPAGLTADDDVLRLLPNHYLDLRTWQAVRHWPCGPVARLRDGRAGEAVALVSTALRNTTIAIARHHPLSLGLSAGRDSRMVLACAREVKDRFADVFSFSYKGDREREVDAWTAARICASQRLPFRALPLPAPAERVRFDYLYRVGYCVHWGKATDFYEACVRAVNLDTVLLTGFAGELGRLFYWRPTDGAEPFTAAECIERLRLEPSPRNLRAMEHWLAGLPAGLDRLMVADLMYAELRAGCWSSPQAYGAAPFRSVVTPWSHRDAVEGVMLMPVPFRQREALADEMLRLMWPALAAWPWQQYCGFEAFRRRAQQRLRPSVNALRRVLGLIRPDAAPTPPSPAPPAAAPRPARAPRVVPNLESRALRADASPARRA